MPIISNFPCKIPTASQIDCDGYDSVAEAMDSIKSAASKAQSTADTAKTAADAAADNITKITNGTTKVGNSNKLNGQTASYYATASNLATVKTAAATAQTAAEAAQSAADTANTAINNITNGTTKVGNSNKLNGQAASYYAKASDVTAITNSKGAANGIATLDANKKLVQMPTLADVGGVNRNLLHNWYFANPVNSKGLSAYPIGANSTTIDRWGTYDAGCTLTDKGLAGIRKSGSVYAYFCQYIDLPPELVGQKMTVSVLADSTNTVVATAFVSDDKGSVSTSFCWGSKAFGGNEDVVSGVGTVPDGTTRIAVIIYIGKADSDSDTGTTLIAAKLELGEEQTLAKKDSAGNWILCEMPDYAEQAAICAQYDSNGKYIGVDRAGHRNYLHNWYFANPVNSRGLSVYPQGSSAIFIDRWMKNGSLEVSLKDDGIVVSNASSYTVTFYQFVDTVKAGLNGREVTASVLVKSSTKPSMQMYWHDGTSQKSLASVK